jgi:hypothetical protein
MVHTNPEFETSNLILDFEFDQHLGSHKHVINIIMWFRDMGCYKYLPNCCLESDFRELLEMLLELNVSTNTYINLKKN